MRNLSTFLAISILTLIFTALSSTPSYAESNLVCICHNVRNNPHQVCSDDNSHREGHENHIESGFDIEGECPVVEPTGTEPTVTPTITGVAQPTPTGTDEPPAIPEFGLLTGLSTLAISTGSYFMLKRGV